MTTLTDAEKHLIQTMPVWASVAQVMQLKEWVRPLLTGYTELQFLGRQMDGMIGELQTRVRELEAEVASLSQEKSFVNDHNKR